VFVENIVSSSGRKVMILPQAYSKANGADRTANDLAAEGWRGMRVYPFSNVDEPKPIKRTHKSEQPNRQQVKIVYGNIMIWLGS
jgi:hypothetical protein